jgi:hypothetical protein
VIVLAQGTFLNFSIDVFRVGFVSAGIAEVLFE